MLNHYQLGENYGVISRKFIYFYTLRHQANATMGAGPLPIAKKPNV